MEQFRSPDIPAYWCYLIVLALGTVAAVSAVNRLLEDITGHWRFMQTWLLLCAYMLLPVAMFWFLDYTSVVHDTSLFGAIIVAVGYRQIFASGIQGVVLPGQTPRLWIPFEAWVNRVADRIATRHKGHLDLRDDQVRREVAADEERLSVLRALAFEFGNEANVKAEVAVVESKPSPEGLSAEQAQELRRREVARILLRHLRAARPETYGKLLLEQGLISRRLHWIWFLDGRAKLRSLALGLVLLAVLVSSLWVFLGWEPAQLGYYRWRFTKTHVTERDRFRSWNWFGERIQRAGNDVSQISSVLSPLVGELSFSGLSADRGRGILDFMLHFRSKGVDRAVVPDLIEALATANVDMRVSIHETLLHIQRKDYLSRPVAPEIIDWKPSAKDLSSDIDGNVRRWREWWKAIPPELMASAMTSRW